MHPYRLRAAGSIPHQELIQINTTNILFICGGAFEGLDKIIETRMDQKSIGFNAEIRDKRRGKCRGASAKMHCRRI